MPPARDGPAAASWVMKSPGERASTQGGYSLLEAMIAVGGLGIIAAVSVFSSANAREQIAEQKLRWDVGRINDAIRTYQASGGAFGARENPSSVLGKLKSRAHAEDVDTIVGLSGRFVDSRLTPVLMTSGERDSDAPRAVWNGVERRFEVRRASSGAEPAVKEFVMDSGDPAEQARNLADAAVTEERGQFVSFSRSSDWIWDYGNETGPAGFAGPTQISAVAGSPAPPPGLPPGLSQLLPPVVSVPGGRHPLADFDLVLTLTNPNDPAASKMYYSTSLGEWAEYTGAFTVKPGASVVAYVQSLDSESWVNSIFDTNSYGAYYETLQLALTAPGSLSYAQAGGAMMAGGPAIAPAAPAHVVLANAADIPDAYEHSDLFNVYWTYDGSDPSAAGDESVDGQGGGGAAGSWVGAAFSGGFPGQNVDISLPRWGSRTSLPLRVAARSTNHDLVRDSSIVVHVIAIAKTTLRAPEFTVSGNNGNGQGDENPIISIDPVTTFGDTPVGARIYYTTDGTDPGGTDIGPAYGTLYTGSFRLIEEAEAAGDSKDAKDAKDSKDPKAAKAPKKAKKAKKAKKVKVKKIKATVTARVYGPEGYQSWFTRSPAASVNVSAKK